MKVDNSFNRASIWESFLIEYTIGSEVIRIEYEAKDFCSEIFEITLKKSS